MNKNHFFTIQEYQISSLQKLATGKDENQYVLLSKYDGFFDIAKYNLKYQNIVLLNVTADRLKGLKKIN